MGVDFAREGEIRGIEQGVGTPIRPRADVQDGQRLRGIRLLHLRTALGSDRG